MKLISLNTASLWTFLLLLTLSYSQNNNSTTTNGTTQTNGTNQQSNTTVIPPWLQQSQTELTTFMSDKYNYFFTPNGNKVWVCTMNLAWNELKREMLSGKNAVFANTTALQDKIVSNLNSELFTGKQLSDESYYASAGYGQKQQEKLNSQVKEKFPNKVFLPLSYELKDQDFISYAYLEKILKFKTPFAADTTFQFKNKTADGFEAKYSKQKKQLYYKYYNNSNEFLMGIETTNPNDEVIILKTNKTEIKNFKMEKVLEIVELYNGLPLNRLKKYDTFKMPVLSFDYQRTYKEMIGMQFKNEEFEDYKISVMFESLKFNLDKSGIKTYSQAIVVAARTVMPMDQKSFLLNSDFWLILKQKNKKPYLVISVSTLKETWAV